MKKVVIHIIFIVLFIINTSSVHAQEKFTKWQDKPLIAVLFSPDGKNLASVGSDKTIKLWSVENGTLLNTLYDNVSGEVAIAFSPDGKNIVSGSWDKDVKIWDVESGKVISRFLGHDKSLRTVSYHPNGKYIASAGWDKDILIWYASTGLLLKSLKGHNQCVRAIEYSPCGKYIASGGYDLYLRIYDVVTGNIILQEKGHKYPIEALSYSPNGKYIATGGNDNFIRIWNISSRSIYKTLTGHTDAIYSVNFSPDGNYLASAGNDNSIKIWDVEKGINVMTFKGHTLTVKSVAFSPNGKLLVSTGADKTIRVWDVSSLNIIPSEKTISTQNIITDNINFNFDEKLKENIEVYDRDFSFIFKIQNQTFDNIRLFINKKEFVSFNGLDTVVVKPKIIQSDDISYIKLQYDLYLHHGNNEIQVYATKNNEEEIYVSNVINISYFDIDKQAKYYNLHVLNFNPIQYSDKKINKEYKLHTTSELETQLLSQKTNLYSEVIINNIFNETNSIDSIQSRISSAISKIKNQDFVILNISGFIINKNNQLHLILPESNLKDITTISLDSIYKLFSKNNYITTIINNQEFTFKLLDTYSAYSSNELLIKISGILNLNNNSYLFFNRDNTINPFEMISKSNDKSIDKNQNSAIDFNEIKEFLQNSVNITFYYKGKLIPFFFTN